MSQYLDILFTFVMLLFVHSFRAEVCKLCVTDANTSDKQHPRHIYTDTRYSRVCFVNILLFTLGKEFRYMLFLVYLRGYLFSHSEFRITEHVYRNLWFCLHDSLRAIFDTTLLCLTVRLVGHSIG